MNEITINTEIYLLVLYLGSFINIKMLCTLLILYMLVVSAVRCGMHNYNYSV